MKILKILFIFFFFQSSFVIADDNFDKDIGKAFKEFTKTIDKQLNKSKKLPKAETVESEIIDKAIKELEVAKDFINETYKSGDLANTENTLDFITRSISDIEKLIPQELSSDMSGIDIQAVNPDDIKKIKQVTDSMKLSKNKKLAEFVENLDSLSNQGLNVYSISYNLNNLGVDTINFAEIINSINSDPALRLKTINSIEKDLKKAGLSAKDVNKVKDEINKISIKKEGITDTQDNPKVKK